MSSDAIEQLITQHVADAMTAYKANRNNGNGSHNEASGSARKTMHMARGYTYKEFLNYQPHNFKRTEGAVGLARWFKKIKSVHIRNYAINCQVKYATCTLLDNALT
ncbi:hypothetical protein Tco_0437941 [Tanacetum coccineum]